MTSNQKSTFIQCNIGRGCLDNNEEDECNNLCTFNINLINLMLDLIYRRFSPDFFARVSYIFNEKEKLLIIWQIVICF